jgi:flagellar protein FliO/FliZ
VTDVSTAELFLRLIVSLGVVLGLMAVAAAVLRKGRGFKATILRRPATVDVVSRQRLSRRASIALIRVSGRELVVGVTDNTITLLSETEVEAEALDEAVEDVPVAPGTARLDGAPTAGTPWKIALDTLRERTVRRA